LSGGQVGDPTGGHGGEDSGGCEKATRTQMHCRLHCGVHGGLGRNATSGGGQRLQESDPEAEQVRPAHHPKMCHQREPHLCLSR
ncbi:hypothetical protein KR067_003780, partial [Drosophila pandora]